MRWVPVTAWGLVLGIAGCADPKPDKPDVLLITWDTVRADHVGDHSTPTWNRLAKRAVVFAYARTPVPITLPAHASIMTGENPPVHGARDNGTWPLTDGLPTLAERFRQAGWTTGAFISASVLDSRYGIGRGFSTYNDHIRPGEDRVVAHRDGAETVEHAIDWLLDKPTEQPVFLWLHLFDPHRPWDKASEAKTTDYQAAITKADSATARLLDVIEARGRLESTIIALTSDHGEGLGEHAESTHGFFAYDSTIRVPMLFWVGDKVSTRPHTSQMTVGGPASLIDVATTLTQAAGLDPIGAHSIDLLAAADHGGVSARDLSIETVIPALDFNAAPIFGVIDHDGRAWFDTPKPERYHLDSDPRQLVNRYRDTHRAEAAAVFHKFPRRWPPKTDPMLLAPEDRAALEALGYITRSITPTALSTVDPKDRIDLFNLLTHTPDAPATTLVKSAELMEKVHGPVPALMRFKADLFDAIARPIDALEALKQAAEAHPTDQDIADEIKVRIRKLDELRHLVEAIQTQLGAAPNDLTAKRDLALTYHRLQRFDEAETMYRSILEANPSADDIRIDFARMFASQQRYDTALGTLAPAMRRPAHASAVDCLAGQLMRRGLGRAQEAAALLKHCQ